MVTFDYKLEYYKTPLYYWNDSNITKYMYSARINVYEGIEFVI